MQFFQRVWMPCLLLYGEYPQRLLRKARTGNLDALSDLLRLDKSVIFDKRIAEITHRSWVENHARFDEIKKAFSGNIPKPTRPKVKVQIEAMILKVYGLLDKNLSSTEIRKLFDIVKSAYSGGREIVDTDLPDDSEALRKAVQRRKKRLKIGAQPGQK